MSTNRKCFKRYFPFLDNDKGLWGFLSNEIWLIISLFGSVMCVGEYARNQTSPMPWEVFIYRSERYDFLTGVISATNVLITDIWILFGLAELKIQSELDSISRESQEILKNEKIKALNYKKNLYYVANIILGLLLMTKHNLLYQLLDWLSPILNTSIADY